MEAIESDVKYIKQNAETFNEPDSEVVRNAGLVTQICLSIIRWESHEIFTFITVTGDGRAGSALIGLFRVF